VCVCYSAPTVWSTVGCAGPQTALLITRAGQEPYILYMALANIYLRCIYVTFGREIIEYTVIYGAYIRCVYTVLAHPNYNHKHSVYNNILAGSLGKEIIVYTVHIYGVYIRFWPTLTTIISTACITASLLVVLAGKSLYIQCIYTVHIYGA
jgi:hypothetical protein